MKEEVERIKKLVGIDHNRWEQPGRRVVRGLLQWPHGHRQQARRRHGSDGN